MNQIERCMRWFCMKFNTISLLILGALAILGCGKIKMGDNEPLVSSFLPGECLSSTELSASPVNKSEFLHFGFQLNLGDISREKTDPRPVTFRYREVPGDKLYSLFGKNESSVKKAFESTFDALAQSYATSWGGSQFSLVTILYQGGISLKADRTFAGYSAGEDIGPALCCIREWSDYAKESGESIVLTPYESYNSAGNIGKYLDIPMDYTSMLGTNVCFGLPAGDYEFTDEHITFELEIPVKVVMYLDWLNNKLSNPDAPIPCRDEVLHCRFTTNFGLR